MSALFADINGDTPILLVLHGLTSAKHSKYLSFNPCCSWTSWDWSLLDPYPASVWLLAQMNHTEPKVFGIRIEP